MSINVLFQARSNLFSSRGGDTTQIIKTKESLEAKGLRVEVSLDLNANLTEFDIVHLFNITQVHESYVQAMNAKAQNKPIALSTIYWNTSEFEAYARRYHPVKRLLHPLLANDTIRQKLLSMNDAIRGNKIDSALKLQRKMGFRAQQVAVLSMADVWLPNARAEYDLIKNDFGMDKPHVIIPNASDKKFSCADKDNFVATYGIEDFVLAVGNMAIRKNYLNLILALKGTRLKLVIIGRVSTVEDRYRKLCEKEASNDVIFIDYLDHELLPSAYAAAKVHVQPSWYETPGLASLEAGLAGCNIVVTDRGSTKEYFKDYAWYCDPSDVGSIRDAVLAAYEVPKTDALRDYILANYTWDKTADATLRAYRVVLDKLA